MILMIMTIIAIVAVREGRLLGTAFHPELTDDLRWHKLFVEMTKSAKASKQADHHSEQPTIRSTVEQWNGDKRCWVPCGN